MNPTPQPTWFDVPAMLDASMPRPRANWWRWVAISALVGLLVATLTSSGDPAAQLALRLLTGFVLAGFMVATFLIALHMNRAAQDERKSLDELESLITLRQWPGAAAMLNHLLMRPMQNHGGRVKALMLLSAVLSRYHRFTDAIDVHNYLLQNVDMDGMSAFQLRVARVMAMLREDHLLDADRAISEIRRMPGASETALFALVNLFRDVKTGHFDEAVEIYEKQKNLFGRQLGHRASDAHLLASAAYLARGRTEDAERALNAATLLAPAVELRRRYPEASRLFETFQPAPAPQEAL